MSASPGMSTALGHLLADRHNGREQAVRGDQLRRELEGDGVYVGHVRRIGEAVEALIRQGWPIASTSAEGYWIAREPEDLEDALREVEQRARRMLRRRRLLRHHIAEMRGQRLLSGWRTWTNS